MKKAYIVKRKYRDKWAICCYFDNKYEHFSWAMYTDYNNTNDLFDRLYQLEKLGYKIEYRYIKEENENEN